jgi:hypothetical protein
LNTYRSSVSVSGAVHTPHQHSIRGSPSQKPSMSMSMSASLTGTAELNNPSLTATVSATASSSYAKKGEIMGEREEFIRKTCSIFSNFDNLEKSLAKASHGVHRLTQEQRERLEEMRENKKVRERAMLSAKHKKSGSRSHSQSDSMVNSRVASRVALGSELDEQEAAIGTPMAVDQSGGGNGAVTEESIGMYLSMDDDGASSRSRDNNLPALAAEKSL